MSQLEQLYRLQQIDTEIREKKQRLGEVLRAQKESSGLRAARGRVEEAAAALQKWRTQNKALSLELEGVNSKTRRSEERLYSGNVKNPKELSDLQHEIASLQRRRAALEDDVLEAMIEIEEAEGEKAAADEALAQIESEWEAVQAGLKKEQNELALRLHELNGLRAQREKLLTPESLKEYESLKLQKGGLAVAGLRANMCLGCRVTVSAQSVKEAREGKIVYCGGCGRIISPVL